MAGLYIHIPFCKSKCIYCDFYSLPSRHDYTTVVDSLIYELNNRRHELATPIETIYIGGGTPSVLPQPLLAKLISALPQEHCKEFTIEANPDDITPDFIKCVHDLGVNRLSMGVQSLNDDILKALRRRHTARQALAAIDTIIENGISNISCDLIYGIPGLTEATWESSLADLLSTPITHLSAYCLTYYEGTPLYSLQQRGEMLPPSDDEIEKQYNAMRLVAASHGFEHYEISNLAKPGYKSRHNSSYWLPDTEWLGIGPSAHSYTERIRRANPSSIEKWQENLPKAYEEEVENATERANSFIFTSLRTSTGLDLSIFSKDIADDILRDAQKFIRNGLMRCDNNHLIILPEHWLIADSITVDLLR
jgi:oxygen-independent coproporphyrinogen-3 oxidase